MPMRSHSAGSQASSTCRMNPAVDDRLVLAAHRFGEGEDEFFLAPVILVAAVGLQACRRRGGDEGFRVGPDHAAENVDLALQRSLHRDR